MSEHTFPWLRRIRVHFDGLGAGTKSYESTGKCDAYRITATVTKEIMGLPPSSELTIYNLSEDTRSALESNTIKVRIEAGWDEGPLAGCNEVFKGDLLSARSTRTGSDIVASLSCLSGINGLAEARKVQTFPVGFPVREVITILAMQIKGVEVDTANIKGVREKVGSGGKSCSALVKDELTRLAREYSFSWCIIDNLFHAIGDEDTQDVCRELKEPYLISVNPLLTGPSAKHEGTEWNCTYASDLLPCYSVKISSKIAPRYNATYRINTVKHTLDCFDDNGFTTTGTGHKWGKNNG